MITSGVEQRIARLESKVNRFRVLIAIQFFLLAALACSRFAGGKVQAQSSPASIRVRSLVIEDNQGHARILMGAPFPSVPERSRKDSPTEAIVFLDENGHDRLTLGRAPDPQVGGRVLHRIAPSFGILIHDDRGDERGSYGWLANGRALITLDRPGAEAWAAVVNDRTGEASMLFNFPPTIAADTAALDMGTKGPLTFLSFKNANGKNRALFSTERGTDPGFRIFNDAGVLKTDLLSQSPTSK